MVKRLNPDLQLNPDLRLRTQPLNTKCTDRISSYTSLWYNSQERNTGYNSPITQQHIVHKYTPVSLYFILNSIHQILKQP